MGVLQIGISAMVIENKTEDLDAYDSNCDDVSNAKAVLMANLSNYGSDVISEKTQGLLKDGFRLTECRIFLAKIMQTRQLTRVVTNPKNVGTNPNRAMGHDTSKLTPTGNLSSFGETFMHTTVNPNLRDTSEKNGGLGSFFSSIPSVLIESTVGGMHDYCDGVMVTLSVASYILMLPRKLVSAAKDDKRKVCAAIEITKKVTTARF
ncbi:hypothetical protein Tco_0228486 [Tanacetum coccineum]